MLRLLLVRHAESEWNAAGRWQGRADSPLSTFGRRQAAAASEVAGVFDAIYASPLDRALTTALAISTTTGVGPVIIVDDLVERDAGEWSGLTRAEIDEHWPGYLAAGRRPPGYELDGPFQARVMPALHEIAAASGSGEVLVLCHGGIIYAVEELLGASFQRVPNLGGRWVTYDDGGFSLGDRVHLIDEAQLTAQAPDIL